VKIVNSCQNADSTPELVILSHMLTAIGRLNSSDFLVELYTAAYFLPIWPDYDLRLVVVCINMLSAPTFSQDLDSDGIAVPTFKAFCTERAVHVFLRRHLGTGAAMVTSNGHTVSEREYVFEIASPDLFDNLLGPIADLDRALAIWR